MKVGRLMQAEGALHLIAKAPQREGSEGVIELHDGAKGSHCSLIRASALAIWACRTFTHLSDTCVTLDFSWGRMQPCSACARVHSAIGSGKHLQQCLICRRHLSQCTSGSLLQIV